jgi:predicted enzyme related to lactoylglutathione lyase
MHKSRMGTIVIDCQTTDVDQAADFWAGALGRAAKANDDPQSAAYRSLAPAAGQLPVLVQAVDHPSRVHLDIETDDVDAEVARLEKLGAKRVKQVKTWWVMEAPTGQRFCVVRPQTPDFATGANVWGD